MKKIVLLVIFVTIPLAIIYGQSPQSFNYQAVARDAMNQPIKSQAIGIRFSVLEGSATGTAMYVESHTPTTSELGIFSVRVGEGTVISGTFSSLDWGANSYWLQVEMDAAGGTNYLLMGANQLVSVPYALHAATVGDKEDADADPLNELQELNLNGTTISITNGNSVDLSVIQDGVDDADADTTNELQTLEFNVATNELSLTKGGKVDLSSLDNDSGTGTGTDDQQLGLNGTVLSIEDGNSVDLAVIQDGVDDADADPSNELQTLSLVSNNLSITNGNTVNLSPFVSPWQSETNGIKYLGRRVRIYDTADLTEEVQINPFVVKVQNNRYESFLRGGDLHFQNLSISPSMVANYGFWGLEFFEPGDPITYFTKFDKDSLYQYAPPIGLLFPSTTKLVPGGLTFQNGLETSRLDFIGMHLSTANFRDLFLSTGDGLQIIEEVTPADRFKRLALQPDSLEMYTDAKWKVVQLGLDRFSNTGSLSLFDGGGLGKVAHLTGNDQLSRGAYFELFSEGERRATMETTFGYGALNLFGVNGLSQFCVAAESTGGGGYACMSDTLEEPQIEMWVTRDSLMYVIEGGELVVSSGHIYSSGEVFAPIIQSVREDTVVAEMNPFGFYTEGEIIINKAKKIRGNFATLLDPSVYMETGDDGEGLVTFRGTNGHANARIFGLAPSMTDNANFGAVYVYNDAGIAQAGMEVDPNTGLGVVWGKSKQFRVDHPEDPDKDIVYASLEGPEAAAYVRGTSTLQNGRVFVAFPEHFRMIANPTSMTVTLTPLFSKTYGLAVVEKTADGIWVEELMEGSGNFSFDWEVKCMRRGYEDFQVIRDKVKLPQKEVKRTPLRNTFAPRPSQDANFKIPSGRRK